MFAHNHRFTETLYLFIYLFDFALTANGELTTYISYGPNVTVWDILSLVTGRERGREVEVEVERYGLGHIISGSGYLRDAESLPEDLPKLV